VRTTLAALPLLLIAAPLAAQPRLPTASEDRNNLTFGLGAAITPSYSGSNDYQLNPGGIIRGKVANFNFSLQGPRLIVDAIRDDDRRIDLQAGPVIGLNLNRVNRIQDDRVKALGDFDLAVEVGGYAGVSWNGVLTSRFDRLSVSLAYQEDVSGVHRSHIWRPQASYGTPLDRASFVLLSVDATIVGSGFARTYFGVTPDGAAASGLATYDLDGGVQDVGVNLVGIRSLSGDIRRGWAAFAIGGYSRLLGDFADSPLVADAGSADQFFGALGLAYTF